MLTVLYWILVVFYVPACLGLIVIVLLQKGKGTGFAGAFGVGPGSETVFGPRARRSLPVRLTYIAAATFMVMALLMSMISGRANKGSAPQLAEVTGETEAALTGLEDLGLGQNQAGAAETVPAAPEESEGSATPLAPGEAPPAPGETPQAEIETFEAPAADPAAEPEVQEAAPVEEAAPAEAAPAEAAPVETAPTETPPPPASTPIP